MTIYVVVVSLSGCFYVSHEIRLNFIDQCFAIDQKIRISNRVFDNFFIFFIIAAVLIFCPYAREYFFMLRALLSLSEVENDFDNSSLVEDVLIRPDVVWNNDVSMSQYRSERS